MGELVASLRRLIGIDPEQKKQQERFQKAKDDLDDQNAELDGLLKDFSAINRAASRKARERTLPPTATAEPKEAVG